MKEGFQQIATQDGENVVAEDVRIEDAIFITAAHDLLEVCKEVLEIIDSPDLTDSKKLWKFGTNFSLARKIEKAIERAEGE